MKLVKILSICLALSTSLTSLEFHAKSNPSSLYSDTPAKTICIKHPAASNIDGFFSTTTVLMFEIYKVGSSEDLDKVITSLKKNSNVESCEKGPLTGDYQAMTLVIKSMKDKKWYGDLFKKAGLNTIKINNNPIVKVDAL